MILWSLIIGFFMTQSHSTDLTEEVDDPLEYFVSLKQEWEDKLDKDMYTTIEVEDHSFNNKEKLQIMLGSFIILLGIYCCYLSI